MMMTVVPSGRVDGEAASSITVLIGSLNGKRLLGSQYRA